MPRDTWKTKYGVTTHLVSTAFCSTHCTQTCENTNRFWYSTHHWTNFNNLLSSQRPWWL